MLDGLFEGKYEVETPIGQDAGRGERHFNQEEVEGYIEGEFRGSLDGEIVAGMEGEFDGEMEPF